MSKFSQFTLVLLVAMLLSTVGYSASMEAPSKSKVEYSITKDATAVAQINSVEIVNVFLNSYLSTVFLVPEAIPITELQGYRIQIKNDIERDNRLYTGILSEKYRKAKISIGRC